MARLTNQAPGPSCPICGMAGARERSHERADLRWYRLAKPMEPVGMRCSES